MLTKKHVMIFGSLLLLTVIAVLFVQRGGKSPTALDFSSTDKTSASEVGRPTAEETNNQLDKSAQIDKFFAGLAASNAPNFHEEVLQAYQVQDIDQLAASIAVLGKDNIDAHYLKTLVRSFCMPSFSDSEVEYYEKLKAHNLVSDSPESLESIKVWQSKRKTFCKDSASVSQLLGDSKFLLDDEALYQRNAEYKLAKDLLDVQLQQKGKLSEQELAQRREEVLSLIANTTSPAAFMRLGSYLVGDDFGDWLPPNQVISTIGKPALAGARQLAVEMEFCRLSNSCGPNSFYYFTTCGLEHCRQGQSVVDARRFIYSPQQYEIALQYAQELQRRRKR